MKKFIITVLLVTILLSVVQGYITVNYEFNKNSVDSIGYTCHNNACSGGNVNQNPWGYNPSSPATSNGELSINFMSWDTLQTQSPDSYMVAFFYAHGYKAHYHRITSNICGVQNCVKPAGTLTFRKVEDCKSEVGNIIYENNIYSDQPLIVKIPANLSSDTSSAFGCTECIVTYTPQQYIDEYYSVHTDIKLRIRNSAGTLVKSQDVHKNILWDTTETVEFDQWTPPTQPDLTETYTIVVRTDVVDDQCANSIPDSASNQVTVWERFPKDECWTEIRGLEVEDPAIPKVVNQPVIVSFEKRSQYAPNYDPWDSEYDTLKKQLATDITLTLKEVGGDVLQEITRRYSATGQFGEWENINFEFTPTESRKEIEIIVEGLARSTTCTGKTNTPASATIDVDIKECVPPDSKTCYSGSAITKNIGECKAGEQTCVNGYWSTCSGEKLPSAEIYDGKDNDCDGEIDENLECSPGQTKACSEIFDGICGVKEATCDNGVWSGCPSPETEVCDDLKDNDCDGYTDCEDKEDCTNFLQQTLNFYPCKIEELQCTSGYKDTNKDLSDGCECKLTSVGLLGDELCNGIDDNCDGFVDNPELLSSVPECSKDDYDFACEDQVAECVDGKFVCEDKRKNETCNTLDDDCDGLIDEGCDIDKDGYAFFNMTCEDSFIDGLNKTRECDERGNEKGDCNDNNADIHPGVNEKCDDIDWNCNGQPDEGCDCTEGEPIECNNKGVCSQLNLVCGIDGQKPACDYSSLPNYENPEVSCDNLDNDCNGIVDTFGDCCNPDILARKPCTKTCSNGEVIQGHINCVDYKWMPLSECIAQCEAPVNLNIIFPQSGKTYKRCEGEEFFNLEFEYDGDDLDSCKYSLNTGSFKGIKGSVQGKFGQNTLTIRCEEVEDSVNFYVEEKNDCEEIVIDPEEAIDEMEDEDVYTEEELEKAEATSSLVDQKITTSYDENTGLTEIGITLQPQKNLGKADYHLRIPKCLAEYLDEVEFDIEDYEVIKEDPIIAWQFAELDRQVNMNYRVKGKIDKECLDQIQGMAIADIIDYKEKKSIIAPVIIVTMVLIGFVVYKWLEVEDKKHHGPGSNNMDNDDPNSPITHTSNQEDSTENALKTIEESELRNLKSKFKKKEDAINYMEQMNYPPKMMEYIKKKF